MASTILKSKYKNGNALRLAFIEEYRKFPCLYDEEETKKTSVEKRRRCWETICEKLGVKEKDLPTLKAIWKNLRDSFRRCHIAAADGSEPCWEFWEAMQWLTEFKDVDLDKEPALKKPKKEVRKEQPSSSAAGGEDSEVIDVGRPQHRTLVEEIIVEEPAQQDPRVEQLIDLLEKQLTVGQTPNVHICHGLGMRVDRLPVEMQDEAIKAMMAALSEYEKKARQPVETIGMQEITGHNTNDDFEERDLVIDENA